jgi:hypothetical protein
MTVVLLAHYSIIGVPGDQEVLCRKCVAVLKEGAFELTQISSVLPGSRSVFHRSGFRVIYEFKPAAARGW